MGRGNCSWSSATRLSTGQQRVTYAIRDRGGNRAEISPNRHNLAGPNLELAPCSGPQWETAMEFFCLLLSLRPPGCDRCFDCSALAIGGFGFVDLLSAAAGVHYYGEFVGSCGRSCAYMRPHCHRRLAAAAGPRPLALGPETGCAITQHYSTQAKIGDIGSFKGNNTRRPLFFLRVLEWH
jgi:hypothetical protein